MTLVSKTKHEQPLQCSLPLREALRRAMNVKPPPDWKATMKNSRPVNVKKRAARPLEKGAQPTSFA